MTSSVFNGKVVSCEKTRLCSLASFLTQVHIMNSVLNFMPLNLNGNFSIYLIYLFQEMGTQKVF
jgi:hypothetical protein